MSWQAPFRGLIFVVRVVLGVLSFLWFRVYRWTIRRLVNSLLVLRPGLARRWRPLSAPSLRNPLILSYLMTNGPRWNTHALIAGAGPLSVHASLTIDVAEAQRSASNWSIVVYTFPGLKTVTTIGSATLKDDQTMWSVPLPAGRYTLGLRYYHWSSTPILPGVFVDGKPAVAALPISSELNALYADLAKRRSWFFFCLHYYVWVLLRYAEYFPKAFVEREFLPVGNPDTRFLYGFVNKKDRVHIQISPGLLSTHDIYLTSYSRASLPMAWCQVTDPDHLGEPSRCRGYYLIRVNARGSGTSVHGDAGITVKVERESGQLKGA